VCALPAAGLPTGVVGVVNPAAPFTIRGNKVAEASARNGNAMQLTKAGVTYTENYIGYGDAALCGAQTTNLLQTYTRLVVSFEMSISPRGSTDYGDAVWLFLGYNADYTAPSNYARLEMNYYTGWAGRDTVRLCPSCLHPCCGTWCQYDVTCIVHALPHLYQL
jgi:hypothetical protein